MKLARSLAVICLMTSAVAQAGTVWRCPGPPVVYREDLSKERAAELACREMEGLPKKPDPKPAPVRKANPDGPRTLFELQGVAPVEEAPAKQKRKLGAIDQWRYESCRETASQAPTATGVKTGMQLCDEKFEQ